MLVILNAKATDEEVKEVTSRLEAWGYKIHISKGVEKLVIGGVGVPEVNELECADVLRSLPFVEDVLIIVKPYHLVAREFRPQGSVIKVDDVEIGGQKVVLMAGPCSVESYEQVYETAKAVKQAGVRILRGGAFKPSTSPYSFQGLGEEGLEILSQVKKEFGLLVVTEVMDPRDVELVSEHADILQIGTRNMHNFRLLSEVGKSGKPVVLKRGFGATIEEWLLAAEYIAKEGNLNIILCERGIRTFEPSTRFTLDINAIPLVKDLSHLPVIADPSHGTGKWQLVPAVSKAAIAAGADGLLIEVHPHPEQALKDGPQSLRIENFLPLVEELRAVAQAVGRTL
ncbi:3-deoxy-7-phosphoheptulonate synthase [bacterium]|nr:3-deoxy-7-phosphoheptulonate synthase [bacterium]